MNINYSIQSRCLFFSQNKGFSTAFVLFTFMTACFPGSYIEGPPYQVDIQPPVILSASTLDEQSLVFKFDEEVRADVENVQISPVLGIVTVEPEHNTLMIYFSEKQTIGLPYIMRVNVSDNSGNSLSFLHQFSGWNPRVPKILINEINPRGSKSTPDCVELFALSDGNLGGLEFVIGAGEKIIDSLIFPAIEINSGDYIVIHAKPEGIPEEIDEVDEPDASGGRLALDSGRDFWMRDAPGLPGNNGAVSLYNRRGGDIIDAVIWSNRDDMPGDEYLGWTATSFPWAEELGLQGAWQAKEDTPLPSETLNVDISTATRSLCRDSTPADSNSPADWHTVPTGGKTFGAINSDEVYIPTTK